MFEQIFKNIDDILYKDPEEDSELDYIGQTSWVMFLRYLDGLEQENKDKAAVDGRTYSYILNMSAISRSALAMDLSILAVLLSK